ncbi:amidohydrolase family protein [Neoroseomonas terrae]|nr:amidohydrolase family protein [Neoroseomonas terrae]
MAQHYLSVREDWLAQTREEPLDPAQPIIDAHHHLWDRPGWRYLADDFARDIAQGGHNILASVYVQARAMLRARGAEELRPVGETEFAAGMAAMSESGGYGPTHICAGIVGFADLRLGAAVRPVLEAHIRAGGGRFRGIRHIAAWDPDPTMLNPAYQPGQHMLLDPVFRAGFAELAPLGLSFDAWLLHPQLDDLVDLARAFPGTAIVLNHIGGPLAIGRYAGRREEARLEWAGAMQRLATCPNVHVKIGGLSMRMLGFGFEAQERPASSAERAQIWRPYVQTCIELFGAQRCLFESNFPVDKGAVGYGVLWNAFKRLAAGASAQEKDDLFWRTAARVYRLDGIPSLREGMVQ